MNCSVCCKNPRELFVFGMRLAFGFWLGFVGINKWIGGADVFVGYINTAFAETFLPSFLVNITAWIILVAEPLLGALLILGIAPTLVWLATAKLMFMLLFGQTILMQHAVVANIWFYLVLALACAALSSAKCSKEQCATDCKCS